MAFRLKPDTAENLRAYSKNSGITQTGIIELALDEFLFSDKALPLCPIITSEEP